MYLAHEKLDPEKTTINPHYSISERFCRICLDVGTESLIFPCLCSGTSKFAHESCLKTWILSKFSEVSLSRCEICKFPYNIQKRTIRECNPKKGMHKEFLCCCMIPILCLILIVMGIILFFVIAYRINLNSDREHSIILIAICLMPLLGSGTILGVALYKVCLVTSLKDWAIFSYTRPNNSIEPAGGGFSLIAEEIS